MTKQELIDELKLQEELAKHDAEEAHGNADDLLIRYIDDEDIAKAYAAITPKWYA